jgi:hypothetical protein
LIDKNINEEVQRTKPWNKFQGYNVGHTYGIGMLFFNLVYLTIENLCCIALSYFVIDKKRGLRRCSAPIVFIEK